MKKWILIPLLAILVVSGGAFLVMREPTEPDYSFSYDPGEYFVTDIMDSYSLLKSDLILEMSDVRRETFYAEQNHRIRNAIIFILRGKTEQDLKNPAVEQDLNREIVRQLNAEFETEEFVKVYFNEFVIQ